MTILLQLKCTVYVITICNGVNESYVIELIQVR